MKICTRCKQEKSLSQFFKSKNTRDGFESKCKSCRKYLKKHPAPKIILPYGYSICNKCKKILSFDMFYKDKRNKSGIQGICKSCVSNYALENKDRIKEYKKEYARKNKIFLQEKKREFYIKNKDKILLERKNRYSENRELFLKKQCEYRLKNNEIIKIKQKKYRDDNNFKIKQKQKDFYAKNKERILQKNKELKNKNLDSFLKRRQNYLNNRRIKDPNFKIKCNLRNAFLMSLKKKNTNKQKSFFEYTGFKIEDYLKHLTSDKLWVDYCNGKEVHIDHIIPCAIYNFLNPEEIKQCWNPRNLRLLPANENIKKKDKIDINLILKFGIQDLLPSWIER